MRRPTMDGQRRRSDHQMAQLRRTLTLEPTRQKSARRSETTCPNLFLKILKQKDLDTRKLTALVVHNCVWSHLVGLRTGKTPRQHRTEARMPRKNNSNVARELLGESRRVKRPQQSTHCQANAAP